MTNTVIDFFPRSCSCQQVLIDEKSRTITCKSCGSDIDPFRYILKIRTMTPADEIALSEKTFTELQDEIAAMRRERENLRIQIASMKRKV